METIDDCKIIELPKIYRKEGAITPVEQYKQVPFDIARVYYLYDVPGGESRGGHAHKKLHQMLVSVMGSFDVIIDDGQQRKRINLNRAYTGLYIPRMIWRELDNFSSGGVCLVLASMPYDKDDYYRNYNYFLKDKLSAF